MLRSEREKIKKKKEEVGFILLEWVQFLFDF
jgi:hypothetical protein